MAVVKLCFVGVPDGDDLQAWGDRVTGEMLDVLESVITDICQDFERKHPEWTVEWGGDIDPCSDLDVDQFPFCEDGQMGACLDIRIGAAKDGEHHSAVDNWSAQESSFLAEGKEPLKDADWQPLLDAAKRNPSYRVWVEIESAREDSHGNLLVDKECLSADLLNGIMPTDGAEGDRS